MKMKIISLILILAALIAPIYAHGVHINTSPDAEVVIIADKSTAALAQKVAAESSINVEVFEFTSPSQVSHELDHFINDYNLKVVAVAYQDTVQEFISQNPESNQQIRISSPDEEDIKNNIQELAGENSTTNTNENVEEDNFMIPFVAGILIGLIAGMGAGVFLMNRANSKKD